MAFIQPCFIKRISSELKEKLKEFGYKDFGKVRYYGESQYLYCEGSAFYESPCIIRDKYNKFIDCVDNEDLFLSIAALRDDSNENQWLTDGKIWGKFDEDSFLHPIQIINYLQSKGHKATIEEIIEHFKDK